MELLLAKFTLILLFLHIAGLFFRKRDRGILCCGLFGCCLKRGHTVNIDKIKILGLYNEYVGNRGGDGTGFWYAGELIKGVDKEKKFGDFVEWNIISPMEGYNTLMGHVRWASAGSKAGKGVEDTHPFKVNNLVLTHNGTIKNIKELCESYEVEYVDKKVDSLLFAEIMDKVGWVGLPKLLQQYRGYAALIWQDEREPNSLYIYHGASKEFLIDNKMREERPLYVLKTEEGVYYSSMFDSLCAIRDNTDDCPEEVTHNRIMKITNGKFTNVKVIIDREDVNIGINSVTTASYQNWNNYHNRTNTNTSTDSKPIVLGLPDSTQLMLLQRETMPKRANRQGNYVYFFRGRYWYNKEEPNGSSSVGLCSGRYFIDKKGNILEKQDGPNWIDRKLEYFFFRGVMMKTPENYATVLRESQTPDHGNYSFYDATGSYNFALNISHHSRYPVTNLLNDCRGLAEQYKFTWWVGGKWATESFSPKFCDRQYQIKNGILINITGNKGDRETLRRDPEQKDLFEDSGQTKEQALTKLQETFEEQAELMGKKVEALLRFVRIVYSSEEAMTSDVPETVWRALYKYYEDVCNDIIGENLWLTSDVEDLCEKHIQTCITDGISIEDNMVGGDKYQSMEEYIMDTLDEEEREQEEYSPNVDEEAPITLDSFPNDLDKIFEERETEKELKKIIGEIRSMRSQADSLSLNISSELAQESALNLYRAVDKMIADLAPQLEKAGKKDLLRELNLINTVF